LSIVLGESHKNIINAEKIQKESFNSAYNNFEEGNPINEAKNRFKANKKNLSIFKVMSSQSSLGNKEEISNYKRSKTNFEGKT